MNENGSENMLIFLESDNTFRNKPYNLPIVNKVIIIDGSYSPDFLKTILVCVETDNNIYL